MDFGTGAAGASFAHLPKIILVTETLLRIFVKDGDLEGSVKELTDGFRCYPLAQAENPPKQKNSRLIWRQVQYDSCER